MGIRQHNDTTSIILGQIIFQDIVFILLSIFKCFIKTPQWFCFCGVGVYFISFRKSLTAFAVMALRHAGLFLGFTSCLAVSAAVSIVSSVRALPLSEASSFGRRMGIGDILPAPARNSVITPSSISA